MGGNVFDLSRPGFSPPVGFAQLVMGVDEVNVSAAVFLLLVLGFVFLVCGFSAGIC